MVSDTMKTYVVCVDSYEQKLFCGMVYYQNFEKKVHFSNLMQLLLIIDSAIKTIGFPEPYSENKEFAGTTRDSQNSDRRPTEAALIGGRGCLATFAIKVLFKQNASWQGIITWLEGKREESFRSSHELIMLMDGALEAGKNLAED